MSKFNSIQLEPLIKEGEYKLNLPYKYFHEKRSYLKFELDHVDERIKNLQERIYKMKSGQPSEADEKNNISLTTLEKWLKDSPTKKSAKQGYDNFMNQYQPDRTIIGNLEEAKKEVLLKENDIQDFFNNEDEEKDYSDDENNPYLLIDKITDKYHLDYNQKDLLMTYMEEIELIDFED